MWVTVTDTRHGVTRKWLEYLADTELAVGSWGKWTHRPAESPDRKARTWTEVGSKISSEVCTAQLSL